jgi:hypothetical protein
MLGQPASADRADVDPCRRGTAWKNDSGGERNEDQPND